MEGHRTKEGKEIIDWQVQEARQDIEARTNKIIEQLEENKKPYHQFTLSFDEVKHKYKEALENNNNND